MKPAFDLKHTKMVSTIALLRGGKYCGRIVANYSDNPNGSVCTATVQLFDPHFLSGTGKAGGYGYDKMSAAVRNALSNMQLDDGSMQNLTTDIDVTHPGVWGTGGKNVREAFEKAGYTYLEVL